MKIAISAQREGLDAPVDPRFGRAPYFLIVNSSTGEQIQVTNENAQAPGGAGVQTAQMIADAGVDVVITGNVGPKAGQVLAQAQIKVHQVRAMTVKEALADFVPGDCGNAHAEMVQEQGPTGSLAPDAMRTFKAAIATDGDHVAAHFGHCPHYTIVDVVEGEIKQQKLIPNPGHRPGFLPGYLAERGINIMIAGGMGISAVELFAEHSIQTITGVQGSIPNVIQQCITGELAAGPSLCDHDQ